jgi:hemolysin III
MSPNNAPEAWILNHIDVSGDDSRPEEVANAVTHAVGVMLAVAGTVLLVIRTSGGSGRGNVWAYVVFGLSMLVTYGSSTTYHLVRGPVIKRITRVLDHLSIFLLIAGTYTAVMASIAEPWTGRILIAVWALAAGGSICTLAFWKRFKPLHVAFYLAMGWLVVVNLPELVAAVSATVLWTMVAGGVAYTLGTVAYAARGIRYHHAVWHGFVLAGSACFFVAVYALG